MTVFTTTIKRWLKLLVLSFNFGVLLLGLSCNPANSSHRLSIQKALNSSVSPSTITDTQERFVTTKPALRINLVVQHGHIIEISGSSDPGAVVMINGMPVASLFDGHSFRHFLGPLPSGTSIISATAQDEHGGVNTQRIVVTLQ